MPISWRGLLSIMSAERQFWLVITATSLSGSSTRFCKMPLLRLTLVDRRGRRMRGLHPDRVARANN